MWFSALFRWTLRRSCRSKQGRQDGRSSRREHRDGETATFACYHLLQPTLTRPLKEIVLSAIRKWAYELVRKENWKTTAVTVCCLQLLSESMKAAEFSFGSSNRQYCFHSVTTSTDPSSDHSPRSRASLSGCTLSARLFHECAHQLASRKSECGKRGSISPWIRAFAKVVKWHFPQRLHRKGLPGELPLRWLEWTRILLRWNTREDGGWSRVGTGRKSAEELAQPTRPVAVVFLLVP